MSGAYLPSVGAVVVLPEMSHANMKHEIPATIDPTLILHVKPAYVNRPKPPKFNSNLMNACKKATTLPLSLA
jgi:hypothetical protein